MIEERKKKCQENNEFQVRVKKNNNKNNDHHWMWNRKTN